MAHFAAELLQGCAGHDLHRVGPHMSAGNVIPEPAGYEVSSLKNPCAAAMAYCGRPKTEAFDYVDEPIRAKSRPDTALSMAMASVREGDGNPGRR
jgi:hypothetical protein